MDNRISTTKRGRAFVGAVAIAALCAQYTTILMSTLGPSQATPANTGERAQWMEPEFAALIDYLYDHRSEAGDGGNFKMSTFNAAAIYLAPLLTLGSKKTGKMCKTKWTLVCQSFLTLLLILIHVS